MPANHETSAIFFDRTTRYRQRRVLGAPTVSSSYGAADAVRVARARGTRSRVQQPVGVARGMFGARKPSRGDHRLDEMLLDDNPTPS